MTAVNTELDIVTLVGEMPVEACEHDNHSTEPQYHADGDEQYVKISTPCGCANDTVIYCGKYVKEVAKLGWVLMECRVCKAHFPMAKAFFPLGPVRQFTP